MILLNSSEGIHFPTKRDLEPFFENDPNRILAKWSGICSRIRSKKFFEFTDNLFDLVDSEVIFRKSVNSDDLTGRIMKLQRGAKSCQEMIIQHSQMKEEKIKEAITNTEKKYLESSFIDKLSKIKITTLEIPESETFSAEFPISKDAFQDNIAVAHFLEFHGLVNYLFDFEEKLFSDEIKNYFGKSVECDQLALIKNLTENYKEMVDKECIPDYILINSELYLKLTKMRILPHGRKLKLGNRILDIITLRKIEKNEMYLVNNDSIELTYQKLNNNRFGMSIKQDPNNPKGSIIYLEMKARAQIINKNGVSRVILKEEDNLLADK